MTVSRIQTRGHCQCCGRIQAVDSRVAKHGYEVKDRGDYGYFVGVCRGHDYAPMEVSREKADDVVTAVREDLVAMGHRIELLQTGKSHPEKITTNRCEWINGKLVPIEIPWADASKYERDDGIESAIYRLVSRIRSATSFANQHEALVNRVHGQPLTEVKLEAPATRIQAGEQRQGDVVLTAKYQDGAMVHYSYYRESSGKTFNAKMASRSWRALPLIAAVTA